MFQGLRSGAPLYIFYKNEPKVCVGEVVSVSTPMPQFGTTYQNGIISPPQNFVDLKITVDGEEINLQKLPAEVTIADFGNTGMVVSESKDAILNEIDAFRNISVRALADVEKHQRNVTECDKMLAELNPHIAKEAEQAKKIAGLESELSEIKAMLAQALKQGS